MKCAHQIHHQPVDRVQPPNDQRLLNALLSDAAPLQLDCSILSIVTMLVSYSPLDRLHKRKAPDADPNYLNQTHQFQN